MELRSDCDRCAALCCIAYPAANMLGFSASKEAGEPCPKLDTCGLCTIYDRREEEGFAGCIRYECFGAGQHVVQHLFGGRDWRDDPALMKPMVDAFLRMRPVSDLNYLVDHASTRETDSARSAKLRRMSDELERIAETAEGLASNSRIAEIERELREVFKELEG